MTRHNIITSSLRACVADVMDAIAKHGPVSVCVDREGDLYVGARSSDAMSVRVARNPAEHVGDYDRRAHSFEVLADLADRAGKMAEYGRQKLGLRAA